MNERRQRAARAWAAGLALLGGLVLASGCEARTSAQGAQTAIAVAQTALPAAQSILPGVQATAQAGATAVAGVLSDPQGVASQLQVLLAGARVEVTTTPDGAASDAVTDVRLRCTDARGTLAQLDPLSRRTAATAALVAVGQYYPKASIELTVIDDNGAPILAGSKLPGQAASIQ